MRVLLELFAHCTKFLLSFDTSQCCGKCIVVRCMHVFVICCRQLFAWYCVINDNINTY